MDLKIDYEATRATGQNVTAKASEFDTLLGQINGLNESLKSCWQGADAATYTTKITEQSEVMKQLKNTMDEIGSYLVKVGDAYEQAMEDNKVQ